MPLWAVHVCTTQSDAGSVYFWRFGPFIAGAAKLIFSVVVFFKTIMTNLSWCGTILIHMGRKMETGRASYGLHVAKKITLTLFVTTENCFGSLPVHQPHTHTPGSSHTITVLKSWSLTHTYEASTLELVAARCHTSPAASWHLWYLVANTLPGPSNSQNNPVPPDRQAAVFTTTKHWRKDSDCSRAFGSRLQPFSSPSRKISCLLKRTIKLSCSAGLQYKWPRAACVVTGQPDSSRFSFPHRSAPLSKHRLFHPP